MRTLAVLAIAAGGGILMWQVLDMLSSDAVSMALGLLFGVFATFPAMALVMAARERGAQDGAGGGYVVRHEHSHRVERTQLEAAYRQGLADGRREAGTSLAVVDGRELVSR